jgi:hypothetical protein
MHGAKDITKLSSYAGAVRELNKALSPRYRALDCLERYVASTQYEHLRSWWDDSVPLRERAPHVVEPVVREAIESYEDLLTTEDHFPALTTQPEEDEEDNDAEGIGLSEKESEGLDKLITELAKQSKLSHAACKALRQALGCGTAVTTLGVKRGKPRIDCIPAKFCWPTWADDDDEKLVKLEVKYPYIADVEDGTVGVWWYRRVIDDQADTIYKPARGEDGQEPERWTTQSKIEHGYGFCPAVWWAHAKGYAGPASGPDGHALHELLLAEIDALNRACSQHNRAGLYAGDPMLCEYGVDPDDNPAPMGRTAYELLPGAKPHKDPTTGAMVGTPEAAGSQPYQGAARPKPARRRGVGVINQYRYSGEGPMPSAELLTLPADALDAVAKDRDDLRAMVARAMAWVQLDRQTLEGPKGGQAGLANLSGKALELLFMRQLNRCGKLRAEIGCEWIRPVVNMLIRIVAHHGGEGLFLRHTEALPALLGKLTRPVLLRAGESAVDEWTGPELTLKWPPYFPPNDKDAEIASKQAKHDYDAGLITKRTAVEKIAPHYGIKDVDAYLEMLEEEDKERAERKERENHSTTAALAGLMKPPAVPGQPPAAKAPPAKKAPPPKPEKRP